MCNSLFVLLRFVIWNGLLDLRKNIQKIKKTTQKFNFHLKNGKKTHKIFVFIRCLISNKSCDVICAFLFVATDRTCAHVICVIDSSSQVPEPTGRSKWVLGYVTTKVT